MSVDQITAGLQAALKAAGASFYLPGGSDFSGNLQLGQIIKGKVLRHFEGSRYLVSFNGQEKVVDSAMPLRTDEIIHGKVIALGDRVELQRIHAERPDASAVRDPAAAKQPADTSLFSRHEQMIDRLFEKYAGKLSGDDRAILLRMIKGAADPDTMTTAGLVLNKLGLGQSPEFLRAVYEVLVTRNPRHGLFSLPETAMQLVSAPALPDEAGKRTAEQLAPLIADLMNQISRKQDGPGHSRDVISDTSSTPTLISNDAETARQQEEMNGGHGQWQNRAIDLGQWVLNAQTQGAVGHRIGTIPFWLGNQLIEVDIAVFDQRAGTNLLNGVKHRQVVIALNMEQLGRIELTARIAGNHLRIGITADESGKTEFVSSHMGQLREALAGAGWEVDEMAYATQVKSSASGVSRSVVEHIVSQDSLNRLM